MEDLSQYSNADLTKKFNDIKEVFQKNIDNKQLRDALNDQLGILVTEIKKRNLDINA